MAMLQLVRKALLPTVSLLCVHSYQLDAPSINLSIIHACTSSPRASPVFVISSSTTSPQSDQESAVDMRQSSRGGEGVIGTVEASH